MTGTNYDLFTHNQSRSYLNHLVCVLIFSTFLYAIFIILSRFRRDVINVHLSTCKVSDILIKF
jgi:hypothetical protein